MWVYVITHEAVSLLKAFGVAMNLSDGILGLTVLAWANCAGDSIANTAIAMQGYPRMGFSACFGSPLLTMLLGVGFSYTLEFIAHGSDKKIPVDFDELLLTLGISLGISLLTWLILMPVTKFQATKYHGMGMVSLYSVLLIILVTVEFAVIENN